MASDEIAGEIGGLSTYASTIAAAMEDQGAAKREIARNYPRSRSGHPVRDR